jgi:thiol-disulfide isomerase/thioredoxin
MMLALAGLTVAGSAKAQDIGLEIGTVAPPATVETLTGKSADLSAYLGKTPIIMEFWATWCDNCKQLEPTIHAILAKYTQVKFIGIAVSVNQTPERVKAYIEAHKLPGEHFFDRRGMASGAYDAPATSYVLVIDKNGKVVYTGLGGKQPKLEEAVKKVM